MPSGWTTSGIDWTSASTMRNSRTEDIVREIYLAVNERDYWVRFNSGDVGTIDRLGRLRADQQLRYIYSKLRSWFKPISEYTGNFTFDNSESVFIDDTITPLNPVNSPEELFYFGYDSYDYSQSGNLENLLNEDLSFLRDYGSFTFRVMLNDLFIIYKILNLDLRNRLFVYRSNGGNYEVRPFINNSTQSLVNGFKSGNDINDDPENPNSTQANTLFYNNNIITYTNFVSNKYQGLWAVNWGNANKNYIVSQQKHGIRFSPVGYDSSTYNISEFNFKSFSYGFLEDGASQDDFNILPTNSYTVGHKIIENEFVNIPSSPIVTWGGEHGFMHQDYVQSGLPVATRNTNFNQNSEQDSFAIPFINLNKEGFLKYYTETP